MWSHMFADRISLKEIDLLNKERIHVALEPILSRLLGPLGFESHRRLVWVRSTDAPIRQVFQLQQLKGAFLCTQFGLSLDFVPHVSGSQVRWHRTPKSAILDLCVEMQNASMLLTYFYGEKRLLEHAPRVLESACLLANDLWATATSVRDLPKAFEQAKRFYDLYGGFPYDSFVQYLIAWAFTLAILGRYDEARREIAKFLRAGRYSASVEVRIRQLLASATGH